MERLRLKPRDKRGHTYMHKGDDVMAPGYVVYWRSGARGEHRYTLEGSLSSALGVLEAEEWLRNGAVRADHVRVETVPCV